jgi:hypothetical protein
VTPYKRTDVVIALARQHESLTYLVNDVGELFPQRVLAKYIDALARLRIATAAMHDLAKLDGSQKGKQCVGRGSKVAV